MVEFEVGDVVTRDGTDLHRIVEFSEARDTMLVICIREPARYEYGDEKLAEPWCKVGETEWNLVRRYSYPSDLTIEGM